MYQGGGMNLRVRPRAKLIGVMLDMPCHDMHYIVSFYCVKFIMLFYKG